MRLAHKPLLAALVLGALAGAAYLGFRTAAHLRHQAEAARQLNSLPDIALRQLDSTQTSSRAWARQRATVIVYFDPDCDHCQHEAAELRSRAADMAQVRLLWVSTASLPALRRFEATYGLQKQIPSLLIGQLPSAAVPGRLGLSVVPSILVYGAEGTLREKLVGQTKVDRILKALRARR